MFSKGKRVVWRKELETLAASVELASLPSGPLRQGLVEVGVPVSDLTSILSALRLSTRWKSSRRSHFSGTRSCLIGDRARPESPANKPREEQNMRYRNYSLLAAGLAAILLMAPGPVMADETASAEIDKRAQDPNQWPAPGRDNQLDALQPAEGHQHRQRQEARDDLVAVDELAARPGRPAHRHRDVGGKPMMFFVSGCPSMAALQLGAGSRSHRSGQSERDLELRQEDRPRRIRPSRGRAATPSIAA